MLIGYNITMGQHYSIESEYIKAEISDRGGELKSLIDTETNIEYIWQGKRAIYPWSSMLMYPIVGKLKDNQYRLGNKYFRLDKNGFAKDLKFEVKNHRKDSISLVLNSDKDTLVSFPFDFNMVLHYKVYGPRLTLTIELKNMGKKELLYSLGFAPVVNLPIDKEALEDYYIEFSHEEERGAYFLDNELVNFHHVDDKRFLVGKRINLTHDMFQKGEMIFKDVNTTSIALKNRATEKAFEIDFGNASYISIWSQPGYPFIQLSPTYGVADAVDSDNDFYKKEGLMVLDQERSTKFEYSFFIR